MGPGLWITLGASGDIQREGNGCWAVFFETYIGAQYGFSLAGFGLKLTFMRKGCTKYWEMSYDAAKMDDGKTVKEYLQQKIEQLVERGERRLGKGAGINKETGKANIFHPDVDYSKCHGTKPWPTLQIGL